MADKKAKLDDIVGKLSDMQAVHSSFAKAESAGLKAADKGDTIGLDESQIVDQAAKYLMKHRMTRKELHPDAEKDAEMLIKYKGHISEYIDHIIRQTGQTREDYMRQLQKEGIKHLLDNVHRFEKSDHIRRYRQGLMADLVRETDYDHKKGLAGDLKKKDSRLSKLSDGEIMHHLSDKIIDYVQETDKYTPYERKKAA